ncbi:flagellar hook assembly protein FlgD [Bacillus shivajii]|uniref:flagellar hook assembly protein FlgD n=1 Tax=Bacillus shivajii TaxID=1983719 RepID=UPI001CF95155|nr:flagellar hook assembly protein FlgD [Bacillus shivajii]UCZ51721.1 flagellar hook assembly protein FlgD [Bacillus shivajii]
MPNTITDSLYLQDYQKRKQASGNADLDKDAFLKILMTQLQNQDPMNPMEDKEFIAQMAQFSSLEQMTNMSEAMQKLVNQQQHDQFVSHSELIGKNVEWEHDVQMEDGSKRKELIDGIVTSVVFKDGKANLIINGEHTVSTKDIKSVSLPNITE